MKTKTLSTLIIAILVAGGALYSQADRPVKTKAVKSKPSIRKASPLVPQAERNVAQVGQKGLEMEIRQWGEEVPSLQEVEARVKRKIKLADESLAGGKPIFRSDGDSVAIIYPKAWISSGPWMWPGQDPRERFANEVAADNANPLNPGQKIEKLVEIAGNPGYAGDGGYNIIDDVSTPRPAYVIWAQDRIEYHSFGFIPVEALIKIAESVAKSN